MWVPHTPCSFPIAVSSSRLNSLFAGNIKVGLRVESPGLADRDRSGDFVEYSTLFSGVDRFGNLIDIDRFGDLIKKGPKKTVSEDLLRKDGEFSSGFSSLSDIDRSGDLVKFDLSVATLLSLALGRQACGCLLYDRCGYFNSKTVRLLSCLLHLTVFLVLLLSLFSKYNLTDSNTVCKLCKCISTTISNNFFANSVDTDFFYVLVIILVDSEIFASISLFKLVNLVYAFFVATNQYTATASVHLPHLSDPRSGKEVTDLVICQRNPMSGQLERLLERRRSVNQCYEKSLKSKLGKIQKILTALKSEEEKITSVDRLTMIDQTASLSLIENSHYDDKLGNIYPQTEVRISNSVSSSVLCKLLMCSIGVCKARPLELFSSLSMIIIIFNYHYNYPLFPATDFLQCKSQLFSETQMDCISFKLVNLLLLIISCILFIGLVLIVVFKLTRQFIDSIIITESAFAELASKSAVFISISSENVLTKCGIAENMTKHMELYDDAIVRPLCLTRTKMLKWSKKMSARKESFDSNSHLGSVGHFEFPLVLSDICLIPVIFYCYCYNFIETNVIPIFFTYLIHGSVILTPFAFYDNFLPDVLNFIIIV